MRSQKQTTMETEVFVKLTDAELVERSQTMSGRVLHIGYLRKKKRDDAKATQAMIDKELNEAERLAKVITEVLEARKQGDLFVDQTTAAEALGKVAAAACTPATARTCPVHGDCSCPGVDGSVVRLVDCGLHGDDSLHWRRPDYIGPAPVPSLANLSEPDDDDGDGDDEEDEEDEEAALEEAPK